MDLIEKLKIDYQHTTKYFLHLSDTRFKLLGILPVVTGLAVAALPGDLDPTKGFAVSLLGLTVTVGLTIYDQRNTQIYDRLVKRARMIEKELGFHPSPVAGGSVGGAFIDRPQRRSLGPIPIIWHDLALALVYAASVGAWFFLTSQEYGRLYGARRLRGIHGL